MEETSREFEFELDFDEPGEFDALADFDAIDDDDDEGGDQVPKDRGFGMNPNPVMPEREDMRTPAEKIATLFDEMQPYRTVLKGIMEFCRESRPTDEVFDFIATVQNAKHPVYSPANFCNFLERSDALRKVFENGEPYDYEPAAETVVEDGVEYLKPAQAPTVYWITTADGAAFLESDNPMERALALLESEADHLDALEAVLNMASAEGGTTARDLAKAIDQNPDFKARGEFSARYVELLHRAEALAWAGRWTITEVGTRTLEAVRRTRES